MVWLDYNPLKRASFWPYERTLEVRASVRLAPNERQAKAKLKVYSCEASAD